MSMNYSIRARMSADSAYSVLDQVFSLGFSFLLLIMIARYLGVAELGKYQFAISVVALISVVTNFGLSAIANREIAKSREKLALYLGSALVVRVLISFPLTLVIAGVMASLTSDGAGSGNILLMAVLYTALLSDILLINGVLMSLHMAKHVLIINAGYKIIAVLSGFILLENRATLLELMGFMAFLMLAVFVYQLLFIRSFEPRFRIQCRPRFCKTFIIQSIPLLSIAVAELISLRIDSVMLGVMTTTDDVGLYAAAYNIYLAGVLVPLAITRVFFPNFVSLFNSVGMRCRAYSLMRKVRNIFLVYSLIAAVLVSTCADELIVFMFGIDMEGAGKALVVLGFGLPLISINRLYNYILIGIKKNKAYLRISVAGAIFNVSLNIVLIPAFDIVGAAIATVLTEGLMLILGHTSVLKGSEALQRS